MGSVECGAARLRSRGTLWSLLDPRQLSRVAYVFVPEGGFFHRAMADIANLPDGPTCSIRRNDTTRRPRHPQKSRRVHELFGRTEGCPSALGTDRVPAGAVEESRTLFSAADPGLEHLAALTNAPGRSRRAFARRAR